MTTDAVLTYIVTPLLTFLLGGGLFQWLGMRRAAYKEDKMDRKSFCEEELTKWQKKAEEQDVRITQLELLCINPVVPEWRKDNKGFYRYVSPSYESVILGPMGLSKEDVLGKTDYDIFPEDFATMLKSIDIEARRSLRNVAIRRNVKFPNNDEMVLVIKEIASDFDGKIVFIGRAYAESYLINSK